MGKARETMHERGVAKLRFPLYYPGDQARMPIAHICETLIQSYSE